MSMTRDRSAIVAIALVLGLALVGCGQEAAEAAHDEPATVEEIPGTEIKRITLSATAAERLDIQSAAVEVDSADGAERFVVPYGAVVWDAGGDTWVYTIPEELVFVREPITLDRIEGNDAFLVDGPAVGMEVVIVGAAELWGTEHGVGGAGH